MSSTPPVVSTTEHLLIFTYFYQVVGYILNSLNKNKKPQCLRCLHTKLFMGLNYDQVSDRGVVLYRWLVQLLRITHLWNVTRIPTMLSSLFLLFSSRAEASRLGWSSLRSHKPNIVHPASLDQEWPSQGLMVHWARVTLASELSDVL